MQPSDEQLMRDYQHGTHDALQQLFERYQTRMFYFCIGLIGNRADAEEITSDVFVALLESPNGFDPAQKFSTWLYAIAHHKCVSHIRKQKRLVLHLPFAHSDVEADTTPEIPDPSDPVWERLKQEDRVRYVQRAIQRLPDEMKTALILRQYHGLNYDDISHVLNCSLANVKILLFRAREHLRLSLAPLIQEERQ